MKCATLVLSGLLLAVLAGCGGGDSGTINTLRGHLESTQEQLESTEEQLDTTKEQLGTAEEKLDTTQEQLDTTQEKLDTTQEKLDTTQEKLDTTQEQLDTTQEQLTEAQQADLRVRAAAFSSQLDAPEQGTATVSWMRERSLQFMPEGSFTRGSAPPSVPGGWSRSASFTRQSGTAADLINDTVYLYTNIQAPGTKAFWKVYGFSPITLGGGNDPVLAKGSAAQAKTEIQNSVTTDVTEITVSGSFDSAGGTFTCTAAACSSIDLGSGDLATSAEIAAHIATSVTFSQGQPTFATPANWTFVPGSLTAGVPRDQDEEYLYFGIWNSEPAVVSGTPDFRYIAGGGATLDNFSSLTGTATFRGGAVGKYATQGQVGQQNAKIGTFTATATLTADFGADDTAGTLSGQITNFREGGSSLAGWSVTLGSETDVGTPAIIGSGNAATGSTVASIGGLAVGGSWGATFYGSNNDRTGATAEQTVAKYPLADLAGVAGWFDATSTNAALAGAFAATPSSN